MNGINKLFFNQNLKRKSEFLKANRIRLALFSFEQKEINEKKKVAEESFSFSNQSYKEQKEKPESKNMEKKISITSHKTANDSFDICSDEENDSSEMSCDEEEI